MSPEATTVRRVLGYCRVSTGQQQEHGTSLDDQREELTRYCALNRLPPPEFFVEVESAGEERQEHRVEMARLMREVGPGCLVLVSKQDRWSRDTIHFLESTRAIIAAGGRFLALAERFDPSTPEGEFAATIMAAVARQERARIKARTLGGRRSLRAKGLNVEGSATFGYVRDAKRLVVDEPAAALVRRIFKLCNGGVSLREIRAMRLEEDPASPPSVGFYHHMLRNRHYLGEMEKAAGSGEWVKTHPAIIDATTFERARAELDRRTLGGKRGTTTARTAGWLARSLCRCFYCDRMMTPAYGGRPKTGGYYVCSGRRTGNGCVNPYVVADEMDRALADEVLAQLGRLKAALGKGRGAEARAAAPVNFEAKRAALKKKRAKAIEWGLSDDTISRDEMRANLATIDEALRKLEVEEEAATRPAPTKAQRRETLKRIEAIRGGWSLMTVEERRRVVRLLAEKVQIRRGKVVVSWRDPMV